MKHSCGNAQKPAGTKRRERERERQRERQRETERERENERSRLREKTRKKERERKREPDTHTPFRFCPFRLMNMIEREGGRGRERESGRGRGKGREGGRERDCWRATPCSERVSSVPPPSSPHTGTPAYNTHI